MSITVNPANTSAWRPPPPQGSGPKPVEPASIEALMAQQKKQHEDVIECLRDILAVLQELNGRSFP